MIPNNAIVQIFSCEDNMDQNIDINKIEHAFWVLKNHIDLVYDSKNINQLLNKIISIYDFPNLFFENMQVTRQRKLNRNRENIDVIKNYNKYDIELYNILKNQNIFHNETSQVTKKKMNII